MSWTPSSRAVIACFVLTLLFTILSVRLIHLQVNKHEEYLILAAAKHKKEILPPTRGNIYDVHGESLAVNEPLENVIANTSLISRDDVLVLVPLLARTLEKSEREIEARLTSGRLHVVLKPRVSEAVAGTLRSEISRLRKTAAVSKNGARGIKYEKDPARIYPNGKTLCHVLGFVNRERQGVQGVEKSMDKQLRGYAGSRFTEHDAKGNEMVQYRRLERPPQHGADVYLTIDMGLQSIVETELDAVMRQFTPKTATIILVRPKTGEVLALANRPNFNLNDLDAAAENPEQMKNRAVMDMFEPGSTFKIVAVGAALNEKRVRPDTVIFCENGVYQYGGRRLTDHHHYADLSVTEIISKSSNIGTAKLALQLGEQKFYEYARRFGFGDRTDILLPNEIPGRLNPPSLWDKLSITRIPMGQGVAVTPIQLTAAMGAVANKGVLMMPQIIHKTVDSDEKEVSFPPLEVRPVIRPEAAVQLTDALQQVVLKGGTAVNAAIPGFRVAGKTGTAEKPGPHGYIPDAHVLSFAGFFPANDPQLLGYVVLDEPQTKRNDNYGGVVAGPIFARIGEKAARYLNLQPDPAALVGPKTLVAKPR